MLLLPELNKVVHAIVLIALMKMGAKGIHFCFA